MSGYHTYKIYIPKTREEISADTVKFFPQSTKMPFMSTTDVITKVVANIGFFGITCTSISDQINW